MRRTYRIVERRILFETSDAEAHEYASTQATVPDDVAELVKKAQRAIARDDLHDDGYGPPPHVTVLYGIGDEDKDTALEVMRRAGPCKARVKGIDLFQNDEQDVVIFALESEDLARLRDELDQAIPDNANSYPEYKPHMTIAYVLPGRGASYRNMASSLVGQEFDLDGLEFSGTKDGDVEKIDLRARAATNEESPLFGTDILAGDMPGTGDDVKKLLYPVLNRSNRRVVSVEEGEDGVNVLLDNGQNLVVNVHKNRGTDRSGDFAVIDHYGEEFRTSDLKDVEALVERLSGPTLEQAGDEPPGAPDADAPPEPRADADAPPEQPKPKPKPMPRAPQSNKVRVTPTDEPDTYRFVVEQPTGERGGRRFDRVDVLLDFLEKNFDKVGNAQRRSVDTIVFKITSPYLPGYRTAAGYPTIIDKMAREIRDAKFDVVPPQHPKPKPGFLSRAAKSVGQYARSLGGLRLSDDIDEDTFTSDVGFTDTIPITRARRRKVKMPGLTKAGGRRKVKRQYKVGESMSKGTTPILVVLRPNQMEALDSKPVWSALRESGVIEARPFTMGEEPFVEVRIDTLRKEWSQANAGVLLDEVGSIDPRIQRKVMEGMLPDTLADVVRAMLPTWCGQVPVDVALKESESFAAAHRARRLQGETVDEEWARDAIANDPGVARSVLEWYGLSREVLQRLAAIDEPPVVSKQPVACAARVILEQETTDPAAGVGGNTGGMPTAAAGAATIQGYSEQEPEGVSVSARNWPAQGMFKIHVLVGDTPQWVYRQVVGHEGEGDQSMIVYRTPEGRVMRMPHEQIDAAAGFGAVVTPDELAGAEPGEEPAPTFEPGGEAPTPEPVPVGEQAAMDPEQDKLGKDAAFTKALTKYQQSKDERDWEDVRREAERVTGKSGPDVDAVLAPFSAGSAEKQPMYGGAYEDEYEVMPPLIDEDEIDEGKIPPQFLSKLDNKKAKADREKKKKEKDGVDEKETRQMKGRKIKEPTHMKALAKKAGVGMDRAMKAWGEAQFDFEKANPDVKKKSDRYYKGVTGYFKKKIGIGSSKKEDVDDDARQAEAVRLFADDEKFHTLLNKFESTKNEGYLLRAVERASRVAGIPITEARVLVDEILEATKATK